MNIDATAKIYKEVTINNITLLKNSTIGDYSKVSNSFINDNVHIGRFNHIDNTILNRYTYTGKNTIILYAKIGSFCSISWDVSIGGANHDYKRISQHSFLYDKKSTLRPEHIEPKYNRFSDDISIGNDVWIGNGAIINRGVNIGDGAVVAANSVVNKNIPPYAIVAGSPAKIKKYRFSQDIINILLDLKWWNWSDDKIKENFMLLSEEPKLKILKELKNDFI